MPLCNVCIVCLCTVYIRYQKHDAIVVTVMGVRNFAVCANYEHESKHAVVCHSFIKPYFAHIVQLIASMWMLCER